MKKKNTIKLFGYNWRVIETMDEAKYNGASFNWKDKTIRINDLYGERKVLLSHEIIEAILVHNNARFYGQEKNSEYHFSFNHTQFLKTDYVIYQAPK